MVFERTTNTPAAFSCTVDESAPSCSCASIVAWCMRRPKKRATAMKSGYGDSTHRVSCQSTCSMTPIAPR